MAADKRSVSGALVICEGACVSWFSRTQKCVTQSATEAEYVVLADVMKEVLFLRQFWRFILTAVGVPCTLVSEDDENAVQLAQNPITNSNSKYIDVRHHFLSMLVGREEASIIHVPSQFQHDNFLTKAVARDSFEFHRNLAVDLWEV